MMNSERDKAANMAEKLPVVLKSFSHRFNTLSNCFCQAQLTIGGLPVPCIYILPHSANLPDINDTQIAVWKCSISQTESVS